MVQIMGSMEDKRTFLTLTFMKTRLWNRLCEHLDLVVHMYMQPYYTIDIFPYHDAIITWTEEKTQKGLLACNIPWIMDGHYSLHNGTLTKWFKLQ
jgi:hypothetical protein